MNGNWSASLMFTKKYLHIYANDLQKIRHIRFVS